MSHSGDWENWDIHSPAYWVMREEMEYRGRVEAARAAAEARCAADRRLARNLNLILAALTVPVVVLVVAALLSEVM